jgi:hypothetical protein
MATISGINTISGLGLGPKHLLRRFSLLFSRRAVGKAAPRHCSFCGKSQEKVQRLVAGPNVFICDECVRLCNEIMAEQTDQPKP